MLQIYCGELYVILSVSEEYLANTEAVVKQLRKDTSGGDPWIVILDAEGKALVTSDGPNGNIGYPVEETEINHFVDMLRQTRQRISDEELSQLDAELETFADKRRKARNAAQQGAQPDTDKPGD